MFAEEPLPTVRVTVFVALLMMKPLVAPGVFALFEVSVPTVCAKPLRSKTPVMEVESVPVVGRTSAAPMRSVPWVTEVPPVCVLAPEMMTVSKPCLVSLPVPLKPPRISRITPRALPVSWPLGCGNRPVSMPPLLAVIFCPTKESPTNSKLTPLPMVR